MTCGVTVMRNRFVRSWPATTKPLRPRDRAEVVALGDALETVYSTDAHFAAYRTHNSHRLNATVVGAGVGIELTTIVFDVDCPTVHGTSAPAPANWREELRRRVSALARAHPHPFYYETRGGARIVYRQQDPTIIESQEQALEWRRCYAVAVAHLSRAFGIVADPACDDWQRLYRLPRVTREPGSHPENRPIWGDPMRIGTLLLTADHTDVEVATRRSKAFARRRAVTFSPLLGSRGSGVLHAVLSGRRDILGTHASGALVVRCPQERIHSTGSTGDGSTLLYPPARGEQFGMIHCLHAHCSSMTARDWLRCFSDSEVRVARGVVDERRSA